MKIIYAFFIIKILLVSFNLPAKQRDLINEICLEVHRDGDFYTSFLYIPKKWEGNKLDEVATFIKVEKLTVSQLSYLDNEIYTDYSIVSTWYEGKASENINFSIKFVSGDAAKIASIPRAFTLRFNEILRSLNCAVKLGAE